MLGPCPCAGQTYWPVAVYEQPGRNEATASGPCPCAGLLQACCGAKAPLLRLRLPNFLWQGVPNLLMDASSGLVLTLLMSLTWSKLQACCRLRLGSTGGHERSGLGGVYLSRCLSWAPYGMVGLWASSKTKGWWPGSRWGWGEYGVLTGPRSISPSLKKKRYDSY